MHNPSLEQIAPKGLKFRHLESLGSGLYLVLDLSQSRECVLDLGVLSAVVDLDPPSSCYFLSEVQSGEPMRAAAGAFLIFEPDFLVDVTEIALCFGKGGRPHFEDLPADSRQQLFRLFSVRGESRVSTLLGTLLNNCMDALLEQMRDRGIAPREADRSALIRRMLRMDLLRLRGIREMSLAAAGKLLIEGWVDRPGSRFQSYKPGLDRQLEVIVDLLEDLGPGRFFWEVPLVSHDYGLSGRSDLQFVDQGGAHTVVELKSSVSNFEPKEEGYVGPDHRAQIHLYDLIHESLSHQGFDHRVAWYSGKNFAPRRPVPPLPEQSRASLLAVRNAIARRSLKLIDPKGLREVWSELIAHKESIPQYNQEAQAFALALEVLLRDGGLECEYLAWMSCLIARENVASQMEICGHERSQPASQLWSRSTLTKSENQSLLYDLKAVGRRGMVQSFLGAGGQSCRFRRGDRLLFYPQPQDLEAPSAPRAFLRCTFVGFKTHGQQALGVQPYLLEVEMQGLSPEMERALESDQLFALEYDSLNSRISLAQIALFLQRMPLFQKGIWLGREVPRFAEYQELDAPDQRVRIAQRAAYAEDLFLIQGPPGCGKTSHLIPALLEQNFARAHAQGRSFSVLILSFTNQATYAICRALHAQKQKLNFDFLHLGRSPVDLGAEQDHPWYEEHNFNTLLGLDAAVLKSNELADRLNRTSVLVSTLASANENVLRLKKFDLLILDEASQVHESAILSHLSFIPKWILIGDHKQLPPVIGQNDELEVPECLMEIGFGAKSEAGFQPRPLASVMERLWRLCKERHAQGHWPDCTALVETQYRMHPHLQAFPSEAYYGSKLRAGREEFPDLSNYYELHMDQSVQWHSQRIFAVDLGDLKRETRDIQYEAVLKWLMRFVQMSSSKGMSLGLIMPYRVDLAAVYQKLMWAGLLSVLEEKHAFKMDTVERFQGDEKDLILFVPGLYHASQWPSLESILPADPTAGEDEVDTRLNVAWTRARAQLVLMGDLGKLRQSPHYRRALSSLPASAHLCYRDMQFEPLYALGEEATEW